MRMDSSASKHHLMALQRNLLGLTVNSVAKLLKFFKILRVQSAGIVPTRLLAPFLGLLNSLNEALGQVVRLMTRQLYKCLGPAYNSEVIGMQLHRFFQKRKWSWNFDGLNSKT